MQDTGSTLATYKRLFIPNPFSSDEENEAKKSAQQQEEDAGNAIKDFMTGVWDSLAGTVMGLLTLVVDLGTLYVDVRWKSVVPIQVPEVLDQEVEKIKQKYEPRLKDPVNTIGGIGQSICDTADEKGIVRSSAMISFPFATLMIPLIRSLASPVMVMEPEMIPATPQATATEITPLPPASSASIHLVTLILFSLSKRLTITERTIA